MSVLPGNAIIREVGLRDGLQSIATILPTPRKLEWIREAYEAGMREIEVGSFVPPRLLPQLADTADVLAYAKTLPGLFASVLVPNLKGAERAIEGRADLLLVPLSASHAHSLANLRKTPDEVARIRATRDAAGSKTLIEGGVWDRVRLGVDVKHIPYKSTGAMVTDLIGGQVEMGVAALPVVQGHLKNGALRAIGVGGKSRAPAAPEIPTIAEQGLPNYDVAGWFAVVGPAKLPAEQVKRIHGAFVTAFAAPEVKEAMDKQGNIINPTTPEAAVQLLRSEMNRYAALVKKADVKVE